MIQNQSHNQTLKKRTRVIHLNILKAEQNGFTTDLNSGDTVRIDDTPLFKKGTDNRRLDDISLAGSR